MFKYETPPWGAKLICSVYLIISCLMLAAFSTYHNWSGNSPAVFKYIFAVFGLIFLLPLAKPSNWYGCVYFSADSKGLNFPASFNEKHNESSLNVSWENVGSIQSEILYGNMRGISIELNIPQSAVDSYFGDVAITNKLLGVSQKRGNFFVIAYANNAFQSVASVVESLNKVKRKFNKV